MCAQQRLSLGIRLVWSESSLSPWRKLVSLATRYSEDSDQTGRMPRLIWVFGGRTVRSHFVGFVMRRLKFLSPKTTKSSTWYISLWKLHVISFGIDMKVSGISINYWKTADITMFLFIKYLKHLRCPAFLKTFERKKWKYEIIICY